MDQPSEEKKDSLAGQANEHKEIDLKSILLPKTGPSIDSAQRVNAGVLLEQEQKATLPTPAPAPTPAPVQAAPKKDDTTVKSLETYRGDIEGLVQEKNVSVVSIAAAEADRAKEHAPEPAPARRRLSTSLYIGGGVLLIVVVGGIWSYIALSQAPVAAVTTATQAPFINVDNTTVVTVDTGTRAGLMDTLNNARLDVKEPLGLIDWLYLAVPGTDAQGNTTQSELSIQDMLSILAPDIPQSLLPTLQGTYLLGVHSYDENEAFLIMSTDSYATAYAAMLQWETTMQNDLSPMFIRTPPVEPNGTATTTQTALAGQASSSQVLPGSFTDQVVDNHDARVVEDQYGNIILLWTFLDQNTIVIANNADTLREIITRIATPPSTGLAQ